MISSVSVELVIARRDCRRAHVLRVCAGGHDGPDVSEVTLGQGGRAGW